MRLLWHVAPALLEHVVAPAAQEFSIGIYTGDSPFSLVPPADVRNPVLTWRDVSDVPAAFVADPFMCHVNQQWFMFFEAVNRLTRKGEIALATSEDGRDWTYQQIVLTEPFHLSYPYVFEWQNDHYMIPETRRGEGVRLYKATEFPRRWSLVGKPIDDGAFLDSSIFRYRDQWWLFTAVPEEDGAATLRLFFAQELTGTWREHPKSPIVKADRHIVRPSGRVLVVDDKPIRFAQDVFPIYGSQVRAFEIVDLSSTRYVERQVGERAVLCAGTALWNQGGMHHIDAHRLADGTWIACVDGFPRVRS